MARIGYVNLELIQDPELRQWMEEARRIGTPRPEIQAIRAHQPDVMRSFTRTWKTIFKSGLVEHALKELVRLRIATAGECNY